MKTVSILEKEFGIQTRILYVKKAHGNEDWHSTLHNHPFTEIFYVFEGGGQMIFEDQKKSVEKHDLIIVNSNVRHTEIAIQGNSYEYYVIGVDGLAFCKDAKESNHDIYPDFLNTNVFQANYAKQPLVLQIIESLYREAKEKPIYSEDYCEKLFELLLLNLLRLDETPLAIEPDRKSNKQLEYVKNYIDTHYSRDLKLNELAKIAYLNKYYLVHRFKELYGMTPIDYLLEKRYSVSLELIETTDYSIKEISSIVGFNSQSYFNQVFKKRSGGLTPTQIKKLQSS
ncbi:MAG: AraC family transcriptional regulator [Tissierellia bacterium]|nr:AraC family transcriptional regulator [Tissierellia bacterium]